MEKEKGLEEVDVYRSSHTNSCFNKRIAEGRTYTYPPYVQRGPLVCAEESGVCFACGKEGNDWQSQPGETRHIVESSYERENVSDCTNVEKTHFCSSVLHNRHFQPQFNSACDFLLSLPRFHFFPCFSLFVLTLSLSCSCIVPPLPYSHLPHIWEALESERMLQREPASG